MRPKSIATVVDVLSTAVPTSSMPMLRSVIAASVLRGAISEIEATKVVFPTAKPPAMMIFTGIGTTSSDAMGTSERGETIEDPFEESSIGTATFVGHANVGHQQALADEIAGQDA